MASAKQPRDTAINLKTTRDVKEGLKELSVLMGEELGAKLTQTQVFEILVSEALRARRIQEYED